VGKGTQAQLLQDRLGACHLSTGDVFRAARGREDCGQSPAMAAALDAMRRGELISDDIVWNLVRERSSCLRCRGGFLLDGFPRTLAQAERLQALLKAEGIELDAVINYELPMRDIVHRLSGRRTCVQCKAVFHTTEQQPKCAGICDLCGAALVQRDDDRAEAITMRMSVYQQCTEPLIDFYGGLGMLVTIQARGTPVEICDRTRGELDARYARLASRSA
jgi:adenylate kinase